MQATSTSRHVIQI